MVSLSGNAPEDVVEKLGVEGIEIKWGQGANDLPPVVVPPVM